MQFYLALTIYFAVAQAKSLCDFVRIMIPDESLGPACNSGPTLANVKSNYPDAWLSDWSSFMTRCGNNPAVQRYTEYDSDASLPKPSAATHTELSDLWLLMVPEDDPLRYRLFRYLEPVYSEDDIFKIMQLSDLPTIQFPHNIIKATVFEILRLPKYNKATTAAYLTADPECGPVLPLINAMKFTAVTIIKQVQTLGDNLRKHSELEPQTCDKCNVFMKSVITGFKNQLPVMKPKELVLRLNKALGNGGLDEDEIEYHSELLSTKAKEHRSASIGQLNEGILRAGVKWPEGAKLTRKIKKDTKVAIKIRHNGISANLRQEAEWFKTFGLSEELSKMTSMAISNIMEEVDLFKEGNNFRLGKKSYCSALNPWIGVPEVYGVLTDENGEGEILIMDFIEHGERIQFENPEWVARLNEIESTMRRGIKLGSRMLMLGADHTAKTMVKGSFAHYDLHNGNQLFDIYTGKFWIVDWGFAGYTSWASSIYITNLLLGLQHVVTHDWEALAKEENLYSGNILKESAADLEEKEMRILYLRYAVNTLVFKDASELFRNALTILRIIQGTGAELPPNAYQDLRSFKFGLQLIAQGSEMLGMGIDGTEGMVLALAQFYRGFASPGVGGSILGKVLHGFALGLTAQVKGNQPQHFTPPLEYPEWKETLDKDEVRHRMEVRIIQAKNDKWKRTSRAIAAACIVPLPAAYAIYQATSIWQNTKQKNEKANIASGIKASSNETLVI